VLSICDRWPSIMTGDIWRVSLGRRRQLRAHFGFVARSVGA
jgi:hypothetical protein